MPAKSEPISRRLSERLLPLLQLTRMALVFTAIADSLCAVLLRARRDTPSSVSMMEFFDVGQAITVVFISMGLYGFGMSLNDIIDRRRDSQIAAHRPLPSGRIGVFTAHMICFVMAVMALVATGFYAGRDDDHPRQAAFSFVLVVGTAILISSYDFAGKYLVGLGLLSLGLIRFFHALIPAPEMPLLWHPLLLLNHVTILSTVAYSWEEKRPPLNKAHWLGVGGGLVLINAAVILLVGLRRHPHYHSYLQAYWITDGLIYPAVAVIAFIIIAVVIKRTASSRRAAGQKLMLYGLLWLIVYDASFVTGYVGWVPGLLLLIFLPVAYLCVQIMRWWSQLVSLSQRPQYQRAGREGDGEVAPR